MMGKMLALLLVLWGSTAFADTPPRLGLNFMRYHWDKPGEKAFDNGEIASLLAALNVDAMRQLVRADLVWRDVEPQNDEWNFSRADSVLLDAPVAPIVTLFSLQYASGSPPWEQGPGAFRPGLGVHAKDYVETVVKRYADKVTYWEIGNEMDHWRAADPGDRKRPPGRRPPHSPPGGYSPEAQGRFVAEVAALIRTHDPDAVILMPGMAGLSPYVLETWLPAFVRGAGPRGFDVVNYHFYGDWRQFEARRDRLAQALRDAGLDDKPVWLTETGSTSSMDLTVRTNYPNSENQQAADVFRRSLLAWGEGDQAVFWHTFVSSPERPRNRWRGYGLCRADGSRKPSFGTMQLLGEHVRGFADIKEMKGLARGQYGYQLTMPNGSERWVVWGKGTTSIPRAKGMTSVVPNTEGRHPFKAVPESIPLSDIPTLLRN
ncbi:MAG: hypothetical protein CL930_06600 [Deltaproteobacteria bacterium]|nr:hypothetical protein [Deltaproteobacteria bacterium]